VDEHPAAADPIARRVFYPLLAVGAGCIAYGVRALLERDVPLDGFALWLLGALALHDLLLAPLVVVAGRLLGRAVAEPWRLAVQVASICAGAVLLFSIPALFGDGADPRDPSRLPNDPARAVPLVLVVVSAVTVAAALLAHRRRR
jgi:hypothetical protein